MTPRISEERKVLARSGGRCAFENCRKSLWADAAPPDRPVVLGQVAHIIAESDLGPRADPFFPREKRNLSENLMLLCNAHHQLVDAQPATYTAEVLRGMKAQHEQWVHETLAASDCEPSTASQAEETLHSTVLAVEKMPSFLFAAPALVGSEGDVREHVRNRALRHGEMTPFALRENMLVAFQNLREVSNPFYGCYDHGAVERYLIEDLLGDTRRSSWPGTLLGRSLNKLTGRKGLELDKDHNRYFFPMVRPGEEVAKTYRPLNRKKARRSVVWQPKSRRTGEPHAYWYHRAVALRVTRVAERRWVMTIRPELRVTIDGYKLLPSDEVGGRVTHKKSRIYNYELLKELQFWRDYLSGSRSQIILPFGDKAQRIVIANELLRTHVTWPGIPAEYSRPFANVRYIDDLWVEVFDEQDDADWFDGGEDGFGG